MNALQQNDPIRDLAHDSLINYYIFGACQKFETTTQSVLNFDRRTKPIPGQYNAFSNIKIITSPNKQTN